MILNQRPTKGEPSKRQSCRPVCSHLPSIFRRNWDRVPKFLFKCVLVVNLNQVRLTFSYGPHITVNLILSISTIFWIYFNGIVWKLTFKGMCSYYSPHITLLPHLKHFGHFLQIFQRKCVVFCCYDLPYNGTSLYSLFWWLSPICSTELSEMGLTALKKILT